MKKYLCILILVSSFIIVSCASMGQLVKPTSNDKLDSWIGKNINEVYKTWGIPTRNQTNSDNSMLLEYAYHEQETTESYTTGGYWIGHGKSRSYILPTYHPEVTKDFYCQITFIAENDIITNYILQGQDEVLANNVKEYSGFTQQFYEKQLETFAKTWHNKSVKKVIQKYGKQYKSETNENIQTITYTKNICIKKHIYICNLIFTIKDNFITDFTYNGDIQAKCRFIHPCR